MKYENRKAVIDCGTNTFHLLIVDIEKDNKLTIIHKEKFPVKIGEGGIEKNILLEQPIQRALDTLQRFKKKITEYHVPYTTATATSAFRNAKNGHEVALQIERHTGIKINIIDGKQEAKLIYKGVAKAIELTLHHQLIMDIGGGSVEFILCNNKGIKWLKSFEIGGQRLLDRFHTDDPISAQNINKLNSYLDQQLEELYEVCQKYKPHTLVGASGSFDTLSEIYCEMTGNYFNEDETLSFNLPINETQEIINDLVKKNHEQRLAVKGMIALRADMIVVAGLLVKRVIEKIHCIEIKTTSYALKEGLLFTNEF